jgi:hypothetical protein
MSGGYIMKTDNSLHGVGKTKHKLVGLIRFFLENIFYRLFKGCTIKPAVIQYIAHQSVVLTFRSGVSEKGRGYWKINNSVIQEYDYKQ